MRNTSTYRFISDWIGNAPGFKIQYHSLNMNGNDPTTTTTTTAVENVDWSQFETHDTNGNDPNTATMTTTTTSDENVDWSQFETHDTNSDYPNTATTITTTTSATCGGSYGSLSGAIKSPSYPDPYPDNADCIYTISLPIGTIIGLSTEMFDIEYGSSCSFDSLEIRNGGSEDSPTLGKFCGTDLPSSIQSTQNDMWIR